MRDNLSVENSAQILALADLHSLKELTTITTTFINSHHTEVMATLGWAKYIRPRVDILEKLYLSNGSQQHNEKGANKSSEAKVRYRIIPPLRIQLPAEQQGEELIDISEE